MSLQRSKYIVVENNLERLKMEFKDQIGKPKDSTKKRSRTQSLSEGLNLRYCLPEEVNRKRQKYLIFKGQFLAKIQHIRSLGQSVQSLAKIYGYIDRNIDQLFEETNRSLLQARWKKLNKHDTKCKLLTLNSSKARGVRAQS